jgi:hypothetical protein
VCFARTGSVGSIHPIAHFVSQAGSLVTRRVLVADATLKRPKRTSSIDRRRKAFCRIDAKPIMVLKNKRSVLDFPSLVSCL